jgi:hypothetical protein
MRQLDRTMMFEKGTNNGDPHTISHRGGRA